jgi:lipopolysaccharide transport system ATP-binding protein
MERFLDTPVKRYSSGMYVRLAFAVAAHLEPEILVVDEVLAVGDIQFQKKCLGKMEEIASAGKTILLVSHHLPTILGLSRRCLLLSDGKLAGDGPTAEIVARYQSSAGHEIVGRSDLDGVERYGTGKARFLAIRTAHRDESGNVLPIPVTGCDLEFEVRILALSDIVAATVALTIYDEPGNRLVDANTLIKGTSLSLKEGEESLVRFRLKNVRLKPGVYIVGLWLGIINNCDIDGVRHATAFRMEARREDVLYTLPFPGFYACEFTSDIRVVN